MTSVLSVVSETDETRCSAAAFLFAKKVIKQRRSLSATQTTLILTTLAEIRRH